MKKKKESDFLFAIDAETYVLGAMLIDKNAYTDVSDLLNENLFYTNTHKVIFNAIRELGESNVSIDVLSVAMKLRKQNKLDEIGGATVITELTRNVASASQIEYYSRILIEFAVKRETAKVCDEIAFLAKKEETDCFELLDNLEKQTANISNLTTNKEVSSIKEIHRERLKEIFARQVESQGLTGVPSGFNDLDRITCGWQPSDLIIVAARPAMGKTALALALLRNPAIDFNIPTAIFSLEMSKQQLIDRLISSESMTYNSKLKSGVFDEYEKNLLITKTSKLAESQIYIDDTPALSILELRAKARRLKKKHNIELIIIDYLQLMSGQSNGKSFSGNREQEVAHISRELKKLAKELNIPIIVLSQLSRAVESRGGDKKPQLSDLRESGAIEQDADLVIFPHRPEYYGITEDENGQSTSNVANIIIAKHRSGALGEVKLGFEGKYTKFYNLNESENIPQPTHTTIKQEISLNDFDLSNNKFFRNANGANDFDETPF